MSDYPTWSQRKAWNNDGMDPDWRPTQSNKCAKLKIISEKLTLAVETLEFVQSQAGIADAGEACRAIIKTARTALKKIRGEK